MVINNIVNVQGCFQAVFVAIRLGGRERRRGTYSQHSTLLQEHLHKHTHTCTHSHTHTLTARIPYLY